MEKVNGEVLINYTEPTKEDIRHMIRKNHCTSQLILDLIDLQNCEVNETLRLYKVNVAPGPLYSIDYPFWVKQILEKQEFEVEDKVTLKSEAKSNKKSKKKK